MDAQISIVEDSVAERSEEAQQVMGSRRRTPSLACILVLLADSITVASRAVTRSAAGQASVAISMEAAFMEAAEGNL